MNRADFVKKMEIILQERSKFQALSQSKDLTRYIESQINQLLKSTKQRITITYETYEEVKPICTHIEVYNEYLNYVQWTSIPTN